MHGKRRGLSSAVSSTRWLVLCSEYWTQQAPTSNCELTHATKRDFIVLWNRVDMGEARTTWHRKASTAATPYAARAAYATRTELCPAACTHSTPGSLATPAGRH